MTIESQETCVLPASWLSSCVFCEASFYYTYILKKTFKPTQEMLEGSVDHKDKETKHIDKVLSSCIGSETLRIAPKVQEVEKEIKSKLLSPKEVEEKQQEIVQVIKEVWEPIKEKLKNENIVIPIAASFSTLPQVVSLISSIEKEKRLGTMVIREFGVRGKHFMGVIDEIKIYPDRIVISEDKKSGIPTDYYIAQLLAYGIAYKEQHNSHIPIVLIMRKTRGKTVWYRELDKEGIDFVMPYYNIAVSLLNKEREPIGTEYPSRCGCCSHTEYCIYK